MNNMAKIKHDIKKCFYNAKDKLILELREQILDLQIALENHQAETAKLKSRLQQTTRYLEIRTKPQRPYSIPRLVDNLIKDNKQALKEGK